MVRTLLVRVSLVVILLAASLGAFPFIGMSSSPAAAEAVAPMYGCGPYPGSYNGNPIGGGEGYSPTYSAADADYVVDTAAELKSALASARSGDIVYVADGATIVLDSSSIMYNSQVGFNVPAGVILAGGRGNPGVTEGTIQLASGFRNSSEDYLLRIRDGSKVIGLNLEGPQDGTSGGNMWRAILANGDDGEIANNEIHGLGVGAVLVDSCTGVWIHHNSMHNIRETQSYYACTVCVSGGDFSSGVHASALVEGNYFNYSCQTMAASRGLSSYTFRFNYIGPDSTGKVIDCHGQDDDSGAYLDQTSDGEYEWPAGEHIEVYNNTSLAKGYGFVRFRGVPTSDGFCSVHNNWTYETKTTLYSGSGGQFAPICQQLWYMPEYGYNTPRDSASESWGNHPWVRMEEYDDWFGSAAPPSTNHAPLTPAAPQGAISGNTGTSYSYSVETTDPDGDSITYTIDWGDGTSSTTASEDSGTAVNSSHAWTAPGTYAVKVRAADSEGSDSEWSPALAVQIASALKTNPVSNNPPTTPATLSGVISGSTSCTYSYLAATTDPDGSALSYTFYWGDGTFTTVPQGDSGVPTCASHAWALPGTYFIRVMATDSEGTASGWSDPLSVTIVGSALANAAGTGGPAASGDTISSTNGQDGDSSQGNPPDNANSGAAPVSTGYESVPSVGAHGSAFILCLLMLVVMVGSAVLLVDAIVRECVPNTRGRLGDFRDRQDH